MKKAQTSKLARTSRLRKRLSHSCRLTKPHNSCQSNADTCWNSLAGVLQELIRLAPGADERCGYSGCQNSRLRWPRQNQSFTNRGTRVLPDQAVPAERTLMSYQRGCLKKACRKEGETWVLRFRITNAEGRRVEHTPLPIGLVADFPTESDAWREADKQGLLARINDARPRRPYFIPASCGALPQG